MFTVTASSSTLTQMLITEARNVANVADVPTDN